MTQWCLSNACRHFYIFSVHIAHIQEYTCQQKGTILLVFGNVCVTASIAGISFLFFLTVPGFIPLWFGGHTSLASVLHCQLIYSFILFTTDAGLVKLLKDTLKAVSLQITNN